MMRHCYHSTALLALIILIASCSTTPPAPQETKLSFINRQVSLARHQQQNNELATALSHWQVILLMNPNHQEARQQHSSLTKTLTEQANTSFKTGLRAFKSGNYKQAQRQFLATLAAAPSHQRARQKLRDIQEIRMSKAQLEKSSMEQQYTLANEEMVASQKRASLGGLQSLLSKGQYQTLIAQAQTLINDNNRDAVNDFVAQAHIGTIADFLSKNMLEKASVEFSKASKLTPGDPGLAELSKSLATAFHQSGRRLLSTDIDKGIAQLEQSLVYDSSNRHVQRLLKQSQIMKKRLSIISGRDNQGTSD